MTSDHGRHGADLRELVTNLEREISTSIQWAVFEPNNEVLWRSVRQRVEDLLFTMWRTGALVGSKPEEAFLVRCDSSTMTQDDLDNGQLVCVIGIAPIRPAEFVIFRIRQLTADTRLS